MNLNKKWSVILTACQKNVNAGIIAHNDRFATAAVASLPAAANCIDIFECDMNVQRLDLKSLPITHRVVKNLITLTTNVSKLKQVRMSKESGFNIIFTFIFPSFKSF